MEGSAANSSDGKMNLEFIVRITGEDGTVIERSVRKDRALPDVAEFDLCTREGFLRDFDAYEQTLVTTRNEIASAVTEAYMETASKKNRKMNR